MHQAECRCTASLRPIVHIQNQCDALSASSDWIQRQVFTELHALLQMSLLTVNIVPAVEGRGPRIFYIHNKHDAQTVIDMLGFLDGRGYLTYPNGIIIPSDPENQLEAGEYFFTLLDAPQGVTHSLVLTESDRFSSARLGCQSPQFWRSKLGHGPAQNSL